MRHLPLLLPALATALATGCLDLHDDDAPELATEVSGLGNFPDVSPQNVQVTSANGGGCMDFPVGLPAGQAPFLQQYPCNTGSNQRLRFETLFNGDFLIRSTFDSTLCLDIPSSNTVPGQDVQFFRCHYGNNQRWVVQAHDANFGTIRPASNTNLCLDVENASTGIARIQLFNCGSPIATNRLWKFRTFIASRTGPACTGNITLGGQTLLPFTQLSYAVPTGNLTGTCNSINNPTFALNCGTQTNWLVVNRTSLPNGTGSFPIACFRQ